MIPGPASAQPRRRGGTLTLGLASLLLVGFGPFTCNDPDVERARAQLRENDPRGAIASVARVEDDATAVHIVRAIGHLMAKEPAEARGALDQAYRTLATAEADGVAPPEADALRHRIAFGRGLAAIQLEEWDTAQVEFGRALELDPEDEDARWNLELAWHRSNPPCPQRDDDHEPDDTRSDAPPYDPEKSDKRLLCPANDDWYALDLQAETLLHVALSGKAEAPKGQELGDDTREVTINLFGPQDPDDRPLRTATVTDGKAVLGLSRAPVSGRYTLQVTGVGNAEFRYDLRVEAMPPCPADDRFEPNNSPSESKPLEDGEHRGLKACPDNSDWFQFKIPADEGRKITVEFDPERGPLEVGLHDPATQAPLAVGRSGKGGMALRAPKKPQEQLLMLRVVTATDRENLYAIKIESDEGEDGEKGDEGDEKQDEEEKKDEQKDEDDKEDEEKDEEDEEEKDDQDEEKQDEEKDEKNQPSPPEPEQPEPPADEVDIERIIDALDDQQRNPQLEKLLREIKVVPQLEDY